MNEDLRQAVILAVLGFVIMICASVGVMKITTAEIACSIVIILGVILVILALALVAYPRSMDAFRRKDIGTSYEEKEEPKE